MSGMKAPLVAICALALLSACSSNSARGGGGGNTPAPPAAPPPADANASLLDLTLAETFDNDATAVTVAAAGDTAAKAETLSVVYNPANGSYTLTVGSRTRAFRSADRDDTVNTADFRGYKVTEGNVVDTLVLGKPGDRGNPLRTKYVGSGFWARAEGGKISSLDSFTYGVETEDANLARTGTGYYSIYLAGYAGSKDGIGNTLSGQGSLQADFLTGDLRLKGRMHELAPGTIPLPYNQVDRTSPDLLREDVDFLGTATISSSTNAFDGLFHYDSADPASGPLEGRFYGPAAEEVGASFAARRDDGSYVTGILTGNTADIVVDPKSAFSAENLSLINLEFPQESPGFQIVRTRDQITLRQDGSGIERSSLSDGNLRHDESLFFHVDANGAISYEILPFSASFGPLEFKETDKVAAESDARFTVYQNQTVDIGRTNRLVLYNPGDGNDEIALTYASFGSYELLSTSNAFDVLRMGWFNYGILTPEIAVPRSGTGSYSGVLHGTAFGSLPGSTWYRLTGTSALDYDFGNDSFTGSISASGTDQVNGGNRDFGTFAMSGGAVAGARNYFQGTVDGGISGNVVGQFNGPAAEEFSGVFNLLITDPDMAGNEITLHGAIAGAR